MRPLRAAPRPVVPPKRRAGLAALVWIGCAAVAGASSAHASPAFPESGYTLVYDLSIPNSANYNNTAVPYSVDTAASIANGSFTRVGYMLQLQTAGGPLEWVSVSMDAFTTVAADLGVPTVASGEIYANQSVTDMNINSNVAGVTTGTNLSGGVIAFWPTCYNAGPSGHYTTGTSTMNTQTCYGSMQVGDPAGTTLFAYNSWDNGPVSDLGIGNDPTGSNPDWTFAANASTYTVKDLSVWVSSASVSVPEPGSLALMVTGLAGLGMVRRRRISRRVRT